MVTAEQELLLQGLMQFLDTPDVQVVESPVDNDKNGAQDQASTAEPVVPIAPKEFTFRRGDYKTGQLPIIETPELPVEDAPDPFVQKDGKKPVIEPEKSYVVSPDKLTSFADMMKDKVEGGESFDWNALPVAQKAAYVVTGVLLAVVLFYAAMLAINFVSGGKQFDPRPTVVAQATSSTLGAGGVMPTAGPSATAVPTPSPGSATSAAVAIGCDGIQFYHSPNVSDVGPCIASDAAVVPTGVYGTDGVWIFMILPSGESKWAKAADYGYSAEQVKAMNLKDYAAAPPPAPKPSAPPAWNPSGGPPPAATATEVPPEPTMTPVPPTITPGCDTHHCTKPDPGRAGIGSKSTAQGDPNDPSAAHP